MRIPRLQDNLSVEHMTKYTIDKGTDLETLIATATHKGARNNRKYIQRTVDLYLDWYNSLMKYRAFTTEEKVDGKFYTVPDQLACRQYALFNTYRRLAKDIGEDTTHWVFNPHQTWLLDD